MAVGGRRPAAQAPALIWPTGARGVCTHVRAHARACTRARAHTHTQATCMCPFVASLWQTAHSSTNPAAGTSTRAARAPPRLGPWGWRPRAAAQGATRPRQVACRRGLTTAPCCRWVRSVCVTVCVCEGEWILQVGARACSQEGCVCVRARVSMCECMLYTGQGWYATWPRRAAGHLAPTTALLHEVACEIRQLRSDIQIRSDQVCTPDTVL